MELISLVEDPFRFCVLLNEALYGHAALVEGVEQVAQASGGEGIA